MQKQKLYQCPDEVDMEQELQNDLMVHVLNYYVYF